MGKKIKPDPCRGGTRVRAIGLGADAAASFFVLAVVMLCGQPCVVAEDGGHGGGIAAQTVVTAVAVGAAASLDPGEPIEPWIHKKMDPKVRTRLEAAFELAVERVSEVEACSDLFDRLGAAGVETLKSGLYFAVDSYHREIEMCRRNTSANSRRAQVLAYTKVGAASTWICSQFASVSTETAAIAVIHEALHHAGLTEKPFDRTAMSSAAITKMVKRACEF